MKAQAKLFIISCDSGTYHIWEQQKTRRAVSRQRLRWLKLERRDIDEGSGIIVYISHVI